MKALIFDIKRFAIHDGPGIRTTVFFKGCPLRCPWCHNPEGISTGREIMIRKERCILCGDCVSVCPEGALSIEGDTLIVDRKKCNYCGECEEACPSNAIEIVGKEYELGELLGEIESDRAFFERSGGGVTLSGGEPLLQCEFASALLKECKERGIHTTLDTSGFTSKSCMERVVEYTDLLLYDLKTLDSGKHKEFTGVPNDLIIENLKIVAEKGKEVIVRIPVIAGFNDGEDEALRIAKLLSTMKSIRKVSLLKYHSAWIEKFKSLGKEYDPYTEGKPEERDIGKAKEIFMRAGFEVSIGA